MEYLSKPKVVLKNSRLSGQTRSFIWVVIIRQEIVDKSFETEVFNYNENN